MIELLKNVGIFQFEKIRTMELPAQKLLVTKGIIVRMNDKMSRLINLVWNEQEDYNDESVEDSLRDLLNYTIYCIMIKKGKLTIEANEDEL